MQPSHPNRPDDAEDQQALGDEAVPVVLQDTRPGYRWPVLSVALPDDVDGDADWEYFAAMVDDHQWSWWLFRARFTWQVFTNWWVARRYVMPRDVRRR